jgi:ribosomal protein S27AE
MESPLPKVCPRCGEPRILAPECPKCGVLYAKAEARAARLAPQPAPARPAAPEPAQPAPFSYAEPERPPHLPPEGLAWSGDLEDARLELRVRQFALPVALGAAWLVVNSPMGGSLIRIFLSMWVHELGHAVTAWFCGFPAIPGPWVTPTWDTRSTLLFLVLATALAGLILRGWFTQRRALMIAGATGLVLQFVGTGMLAPSKAMQLVFFGGDAGCLIIGSLLMATVYAPRDSALRRGWLHWGYLVIGATSFMDAFSQWWAARSDYERIPFGENEGVGLSDASTLADIHGWTETELIRRYTWLGLACLAALAVLYTVGLLRARAALHALEHGRDAS